jgi:hypothetical protein
MIYVIQVSKTIMYSLGDVSYSFDLIFHGYANYIEATTVLENILESYSKNENYTQLERASQFDLLPSEVVAEFVTYVKGESHYETVLFKELEVSD